MLARLKRSAEDAKIRLSSAETTSIVVSSPIYGNCSFNLTRVAFEDLNSDLFVMAMDMVDRILHTHSQAFSLSRVSYLALPPLETDADSIVQLRS